MRFGLGRSALVPDPCALPCSSGGSLPLLWRCPGFALAFLVRSLLLTLRLAALSRLVFFSLFFVVFLIGVLVGREIVLQFLVLGGLALCLGGAFSGFVL